MLNFFLLFPIRRKNFKLLLEFSIHVIHVTGKENNNQSFMLVYCLIVSMTAVCTCYQNIVCWRLIIFSPSISIPSIFRWSINHPEVLGKTNQFYRGETVGYKRTARTFHFGTYILNGKKREQTRGAKLFCAMKVIVREVFPLYILVDLSHKFQIRIDRLVIQFAHISVNTVYR